jgi:hypothetical protein
VPASPEKPYQLTLEEQDGFLTAHVRGETDSVATSLAYWNEIADEARRRGYQRMLVLEYFRNAASLMDVYQVAEQLPEIIHGLTVAFVDAQADQFEANQFGEDVAVNRGAVGRVFRTEEAARDWLRSMAK